MSSAPTAKAQFDAFDPNDPRNGDDYMWATYSPGRGRSGFRMHMGRGPALNACTHKSLFILYSWDKANSRWQEVCRREGSKTVCDACGKDTKDDPNRFSRLRWMFVGKPKLRYVGLCSKCVGYDNGIAGPYYGMGSAPVDQRVLV